MFSCNTGKPIRWYVMTSIDTDDKTQNFFKDHNYFGLNAQDVVFFQQGLLPCLTKDGHIMLESAGRVAMAPDGNGGLYHGMCCMCWIRVCVRRDRCATFECVG